MTPAIESRRRLLIFSKPSVAGRVKTRLTGDLTAEQAARLHAAFLADLVEGLAGGAFELEMAWALAEGEALPAAGDSPAFALPARFQRGDDLGERLFGALAEAAVEARFVAAVGADHPRLAAATVERAFALLEAGAARVVLGPSRDGGYYLLAVGGRDLSRELFAGIPWSTETVLEETVARCRRLRLGVALLPEARDVDTPEDLAALAWDLAAEPGGCPRTRRLLARWGFNPRR